MKWPVPMILIASALAGFGVYVLISTPTRTSTPTQQAVPLPPANAMRAEPTVELTPPKPLKVYRPAAKAKMRLPDPVQADAAQHVTATARLTTEERPYSLTTVLDTNSGTSTIYAKAEPLPLFAFTTRGEAGMAYGLRDGQPIGRLYVMQDFARIKSAKVGAMATLDQDGRYFVGVRAALTW